MGNYWNKRTTITDKPIIFMSSSNFTCPYIIVIAEESYQIVDTRMYNYAHKPLNNPSMPNHYRLVSSHSSLLNVKRKITRLLNK